MLKVVNKKFIEEQLLNGGFIKYDTFDAKVYLLNNKREVVGAIRFNTFLQLDTSMESLRKHDPTFVREHEPWDLYEYYYLRDTNINKKKIWRY